MRTVTRRGEPDGVSPSGQGDQPGAVDGPLDLDRGAFDDRADSHRWRSSRAAAIDKQLVQLRPGSAVTGRS